ncbi:unnamed protein product [Phytomonas sp. Hart1]|nr:unnamed protein product [Phytomonas sp. Hart1]|eukprot:CCW66398.1 unnamed protein product [Phytomonas sp. isolate Hart1]
MNQDAKMAYNTHIKAASPREQVMFTGSPSFPPSGNNNPMLQMGLQYGQNIIQQGLQQSKKEISPYMPFFLMNLRNYFCVDNEYVRSKLGIIYFPFFRRFTRSSGGEGGGVAMDTVGNSIGFSDDAALNGHYEANTKAPPLILPIHNCYGLDLYIPLMATITYIVLSAFVFGSQHHRPVTQEYLFSTASAVVFWSVLETIALKLFVHILHLVRWVSVLDIIALSGYKNVLVCTVVLIRRVTLMSNYTFLIPFLLYITAANSFFINKTIILMCTHEDGRVPPRARFFSYIACILQFTTLLWLCIRPFGV